MKISHWVAVLTLLASVSLYAEVEVYRGYQTEGDEKCTGDFVIAGSVKELRKYDKQNDDWTLRSYIRVVPPDECKEYTGSNPVFVTPGSLPGKTEAPKVYIPVVFPILDGDLISTERVKELLEYWRSKTEDIPPIVNWVGKETGARSSPTTEPEWKISVFPPDSVRRGDLNIKYDPWRITLYVNNITIHATSNDIPPQDLAMNVQMEEYIHAAQVEALINLYGITKEEFRFFSEPDKYIMEIEAKTHIQDTMWPLLFGILPPTLMHAPPKPDGFDEKLPEFRELLKKVYKKNN